MTGELDGNVLHHPMHAKNLHFNPYIYILYDQTNMPYNLTLLYFAEFVINALNKYFYITSTLSINPPTVSNAR